MKPTYYAVFLALAIMLSCQTKPKQETTTQPAAESTTVDLTKRPANDAPRSAADRLVRSLYFEHDKQENPFLEANATLAEQFFTKETAALVVKHGAHTKANRKKINPLFNAPDSAVEKRWVLPAAVSGEKAVVFVTYQQADKEQEMRCELQQQANGRWRIADIVYADGQRLTGIMR